RVRLLLSAGRAAIRLRAMPSPPRASVSAPFSWHINCVVTAVEPGMKPTLHGVTHIPREDDDQEAGGLVLRPPTSWGGDVGPAQDDQQALSLANERAADASDDADDADVGVV